MTDRQFLSEHAGMILQILRLHDYVIPVLHCTPQALAHIGYPERSI